MTSAKLHRVPCLRALDPELRRRRLLAARSYVAHSISRFAILSGQWDGGSIVLEAGRSKESTQEEGKTWTRS